MSAAENAAARLDADLYLPAHLKTLYEKFRVEIGEKIDGHDTYVIAGRTEGAPLISGQGIGPAAATRALRRNSSRP
jgi:hypothetical protein